MTRTGLHPSTVAPFGGQKHSQCRCARAPARCKPRLSHYRSTQRAANDRTPVCRPFSGYCTFVDNSPVQWPVIDGRALPSCAGLAWKTGLHRSQQNESCTLTPSPNLELHHQAVLSLAMKDCRPSSRQWPYCFVASLSGTSGGIAQCRAVWDSGAGVSLIRRASRLVLGRTYQTLPLAFTKRGVCLLALTGTVQVPSRIDVFLKIACQLCAVFIITHYSEESRMPTLPNVLAGVRVFVR